MEKLELVASKIGVTAEYMFGVYIQQARVEIMTFCVLAICAFLAWTTTYFIVRKTLKVGFCFETSWGGQDLTFNGFICIVSGIVSVAFLIAILVDSSNLFTCIVNPEYYALKELFTSIK